MAVAIGAMLAPVSTAARADPRERFTVLEENDSLYFNSDKHYTQGLRLSYLSPEILADGGSDRPFDLIGNVPSVLQPAPGLERSRRYAVFFGQSLFTPKDLPRRPPDPRDRPYGAWLYGGISLLQETDRRTLENVELQVGIVGPAALGREIQNDWHQLIGKKTACWCDQIQTEPGITFSYERKWRLPVIGDAAEGLDAIPEGGATLGNVFTYAQAGVLLRVGRNLGMDYGPVRVRPALSGTDYVNADHATGDFGYYLYAGTQGRAVGQNIFLDGNTFRASPHVPKKTFVADLQAGVALFWTSGVRLDFSVVRRTPEFKGQATPDVIGTAALSFGW
jgi:lipid A 3-O-deacylase